MLKVDMMDHAQDREDPKVHPGEAAHMFFFSMHYASIKPTHPARRGLCSAIHTAYCLLAHYFQEGKELSKLRNIEQRLAPLVTSLHWVEIGVRPVESNDPSNFGSGAFRTICWVAYWFTFCIDLAICFYLMDSTLLVSLWKCTVYFNFYASTVCFLWFAVHGLIFVCMGYLCRCFNVFNVLLELFPRAILEPSTCDRSTGPFEAAIPRAAGQR